MAGMIEKRCHRQKMMGVSAKGGEGTQGRMARERDGDSNSDQRVDQRVDPRVDQRGDESWVITGKIGIILMSTFCRWEKPLTVRQQPSRESTQLEFIGSGRYGLTSPLPMVVMPTQGSHCDSERSYLRRKRRHAPKLSTCKAQACANPWTFLDRCEKSHRCESCASHRADRVEPGERMP